MARSRKTPPLFEVMRETDRKPEPPPGARPVAGPGGILPRPVEHVPGRDSEPAMPPTGVDRVFPRLENTREPSVEHPVVPPGVPLGADEDSLPPSMRSHGGNKPRRLAVSLPTVLITVGLLVAAITVISVIAYTAGQNRERFDLLPKDGAPPSMGAKPDKSPKELEDAPATKTQPKPPAPAAIGDDPREKGKNYLIVAELIFKEAQSAAQFLTDNGAPSAVVPPEAKLKSEEDLKKFKEDPKSRWHVIVREGYTRDEYKNNRDTLAEKVKQIGRRWKQDHKGPSDFSSCFWDKFGK